MPDAVPVLQRGQRCWLPDDGGRRWPGSTPAVPTHAQAAGGTPCSRCRTDAAVTRSNQLPVNTDTRVATPSTVACNATPTPLVRDSSLYGSVEPQVAASAANGYTTTNSGAQATVAGDITVLDLKVDVLIGDA